MTVTNADDRADPEGSITTADTVRLTGTLVCGNADEAALVVDHMAEHVSLTRAEPGCQLFEVTPTSDPLVWRVEEQFGDAAAFHAHQARVAASEWGRATAGIDRRYEITGLAP